MLEELKGKSDSAFEKWFKEYVKKLEQALRESAEEGYSGHKIRLDDDGESEEFRIMVGHPNFMKSMEEHFSELNVYKNIEDWENSMLGYKYKKVFLHINWR